MDIAARAEPITSAMRASSPALIVKDLQVHFRRTGSLLHRLAGRGGMIRAVAGVSFRVERGEIVGIVGESGSGKTTLALTLAMAIPPTSGDFSIGDVSWRESHRPERNRLRRNVAMVFQDPYASLNPVMTVYQTVAEPLIISGVIQREERERRVAVALAQVSLPLEEFGHLYPHELSGGQRQRVSISRAIVPVPRLLIADEPVSMLDVSLRAGIHGILRDFVHDGDRALVLISHDISTLRLVCDRIVVMYGGRMVEIAGTEELLGHPAHPYTKDLMAAIPVKDPRVKRPRHITHVIDHPCFIERGCVYRARCGFASDECSQVEPTLESVGSRHQVACLYR